MFILETIQKFRTPEHKQENSCMKKPCFFPQAKKKKKSYTNIKAAYSLQSKQTNKQKKASEYII